MRPETHDEEPVRDLDLDHDGARSPSQSFAHGLVERGRGQLLLSGPRRLTMETERLFGKSSLF